jgi:adenylosuccinate synthase
MVKSIIDVARRGGQDDIPAPNLRYIGVGPDPDQIIRDVPDTATLLRDAGE